MKAICNGQVIAESETTVVVEGNHYFPRASLADEFFTTSQTTSICSWKGTAHYLNVVVDGKPKLMLLGITRTRSQLRLKSRIELLSGEQLRFRANGPDVNGLGLY